MKTLALITCAAAAAVFAGGCSSDATFHSIRSNPTPELSGMAERKVDREKNFYLTADANMRMLNDDISRALLADNPSRLSPYPVVGPGGPR